MTALLPFHDKGFLVASAIVTVGLILILLATGFEVTFAFLQNGAWNSVLACAKTFPRIKVLTGKEEKKVKDPIFARKKLKCSNSKDYLEYLERNSGGDYTFVLLLIMFLLGVGVVIVAFYREKMAQKRVAAEGEEIGPDDPDIDKAKNPITLGIQVAFAGLGFLIIVPYLTIMFAKSDYREKTTAILGHLERNGSAPNLDVTVAEGMTCIDTKDEPLVSEKTESICIRDPLWHRIIIVCSLEEDMPEDAAVQGYMKWKGDRLKITGKLGDDNATAVETTWSYTYGHLQELGFCPRTHWRKIDSILILLAALFLCSLPLAVYLTHCDCHHHTGPHPEDKKPSIENDDENVERPSIYPAPSTGAIKPSIVSTASMRSGASVRPAPSILKPSPSVASMRPQSPPPPPPPPKPLGGPNSGKPKPAMRKSVAGLSPDKPKVNNPKRRPQTT